MADDALKEAGEPKAEAPKKSSSTSSEFADALERLMERAKADGIRPLKEVAGTYAKRGLGVLDALLGALENEGPAKKKAPRRKKKAT